MTRLLIAVMFILAQCVSFEKAENSQDGLNKLNDNDGDQLRGDLFRNFKPSNVTLRSRKLSSKTCTQEDYHRDRCPDRRFISYSGTCRYHSSGNTHARSWDDAWTFCRSLGANLLDFSHQYVMDVMDQALWAKTEWVGARYRGREGKYVWTDGSPVTPQPQRSGDCVYASAVITRFVELRFLSTNCGNRLHFSCIKSSALPASEERHNYQWKIILSGAENGWLGIGDEYHIHCEGVRKTQSNQTLCYKFIAPLGKGHFCPRHIGHTFERNHGVCTRRYVLRTESALPLNYNNTHVRCCFKRFYSENFDSCSYSYQLIMKHKAKQPFFTWDHGSRTIVSGSGRTLSGRCNGRMGESRAASLAFISSRKSRYWLAVFYMKTRGNVLEKVVKTVDLQEMVKTDGVLVKKPGLIGFNFEIHFILDVSNGNDDGAYFACFSYEITKDTIFKPGLIRSDPLAARSRKLNFKFLAKTPTLEVSYHEPSGIVYGGEIVEASCTAYVGSAGFIVWVAHLIKHPLDCHYSISKYSEYIPEGYNASYSSEPYFEGEDYEGPKHKSQLLITVSQSLDNTKIQCFSKDKNFLKLGDTLLDAYGVSSRIMFVRYKAKKPTLKTSFMLAEEGEFILAKCSAFVGSNGTLSIELIEDGIIQCIVQLHKNGSHACSSKILHEERSHDPFNGPKLSVTISMQSLMGVKFGLVACFSHSVSTSAIGDRFNEDTARKALAEIQMVEYKRLRSYPNGQVGFIILTVVSLVLLGLSVIMCRLRAKQDTYTGDEEDDLYEEGFLTRIESDEDLSQSDSFDSDRLPSCSSIDEPFLFDERRSQALSNERSMSPGRHSKNIDNLPAIV